MGQSAQIAWRHTPTPRGAGRISKEELARREEALMVAPLFAELPKRHVRSIARVTGVRSFPQDATVVKEGTAGSTFFVILEGRARVVRRGRTVARLSPGDFFGEISLLDSGPRTASVVGETPLLCLSLAGQDFRDILGREPVLCLRVLRDLAKRLRERENPLVG